MVSVFFAIWIKDRIINVSGLGYNPVGDFTIDGEPIRKEETATLVGISK